MTCYLVSLCPYSTTIVSIPWDAEAFASKVKARWVKYDDDDDNDNDNVMLTPDNVYLP